MKKYVYSEAKQVVVWISIKPVKVDTNIVLYQNLVKDTILNIDRYRIISSVILVKFSKIISTDICIDNLFLLLKVNI